MESRPTDPLPNTPRAEDAARSSAGASGGGASDRSVAGMPSIAPAPFGAPSPLVAEIKERLAEIARREAAVKLRETELEQQYRLMQQFVRDEAERELNEARARLGARSDELDAQAIDLTRRRSELDQRADALAEAQARIEHKHRQIVEAEQALGAARQDLSETATREGDQRDRERRALLSRIEIIRRREEDLERRIARARDEIVRQRATLNEEQAAHQRSAAALAARRGEVEVELKAVRARQDEDFRRQRSDLAADLQRQQEDVAALARKQREDGAAEVHALRKQVATEVQAWRADAATDLQRQQEQLDVDLHDRRAELAALTADYDERRSVLDAAATEVREGRAALAAERTDVDARRTALAREETALIATRDALDVQQRQLQQFEQSTAQTRARLQRELDAIQARRDKLAAEAVEHERRAAEQAARDAQLKQRGEELRRETEQLAARSAEQVRQQRASEAALERERRAADADLEKRRRKTESELEKRRVTIEASLKEQRATAQREVDAWRDRTEAELAARQKRIDERDANTAVLEEDLLRLREEAAALRDQAEARDAETRQAALAAELDRQQVERERALLDAAYADVMQLREQRDTDLMTARAALRARAERLRAAERARFAAPRMWWVRATLLAGVAGVAGAAASWKWDAPVFQTDVRLAIQSAGRDAALVTGQHAAALLTPDVLPVEVVGGLGEAWNAALADGRVIVRAAPDDSTILLSVRDADAARSRGLAVAAAEAYVGAVNDVEPLTQIPSAYTDLTRRREGVEAELGPLRALRVELATLLAGLPPADERERRLNESLSLRDQHRAAADQLARERDELGALLAGANPRGVLKEDRFASACAADAMLRENEAEFSRSASRFQLELGAALGEPVGALASYEKAVEAYATAVRAQHAQQPAPDASAVLEEAAAEAEERRAAVTTFDAAWRTRRAAAAGLSAEAQIIELIEQQTAAAEAARAFGEAGAAFVESQERRIQALTETSDGGTRSAVLTNHLRAALADVRDAQRTLEGGLARVELSGNVDLDALSQRLRGLRNQITQRREIIRQDLQLEADRAAQSNYDGRLAEVKATVRRLDSEREAALVRLTDTLDALRGLENIVLERRRLEDRIAFTEQAIIQLEAQQAQLDQMLAEAQRSGPTPDRLTLAGPASQRQVAGLERERSAALAGAAAFGAAGLMCVLMLIRNPLARRVPDGDAEPEAPFVALAPRVESR